jgi:hypothetical protein
MKNPPSWDSFAGRSAAGRHLQQHTLMMPPRLRLFAVAVLAGCGSSTVDPIRVCTDELRSTIIVNVTDAKTGASAAVGSTVIVRNATFYDSLQVTTQIMPPSTAYIAWEDRAKGGRYTVQVRKPGYLDWIKTDVDVPSDECHSRPGPTVAAMLQPSS